MMRNVHTLVFPFLFACSDKSDVGDSLAPVDSAPDSTAMDSPDDSPTESPTDSEPDSPADDSHETADTVDTGVPPEEGELVCYTVIETFDNDIVVIRVDMVTSLWWEEARFPVSAGPTATIATGGLARIGDSFFLPVISEGTTTAWMRLDVATGEWEAGSPTAAVDPEYRGCSETIGETDEDPPRLAALRFDFYDSNHLALYADWEALNADDYDSDVDGFSDSRFTIDGEQVFTGWADPRIRVRDATTGGLLREVSLEGYDTWIWGMAVVGDTLLLLNNGLDDGGEQRIALFDKETGGSLGDVYLETSTGWEALGYFPYGAHGLWCDLE